jgi:hypothetical protein
LSTPIAVVAFLLGYNVYLASVAPYSSVSPQLSRRCRSERSKQALSFIGEHDMARLVGLALLHRHDTGIRIEICDAHCR